MEKIKWRRRKNEVGGGEQSKSNGEREEENEKDRMWGGRGL